MTSVIPEEGSLLLSSDYLLPATAAVIMLVPTINRFLSLLSSSSLALPIVRPEARALSSLASFSSLPLSLSHLSDRDKVMLENKKRGKKKSAYEDSSSLPESSSTLFYDPLRPVPIPYEWSGSFAPSLMRVWLTKLLFQLMYQRALAAEERKRRKQRCAERKRERRVEKEEEEKGSTEREALRSFSLFVKERQRNDLRCMRQPFLALICPPTVPFRVEFSRLSSSAVMYKVSHSVKRNEKKKREESLHSPFSLPEASSRRAVYYVHGGGFVSGDFAGFKSYIAGLAAALSCPVFFPQYRLAPEHSLEAVIQDVLEGYLRLLRETDYEEIILMADSAGGCLSLLLLSRLHGLAVKQPSKAVFFSPVTDLSCSGASFQENRVRDVTLSAEIVSSLFQRVRGETDGKDGKVSPLWGTFAPSFPSMLFFVSDDEIFLSDSVRYVERARKEGIDAQLRVKRRLFHGWQFVPHLLPEAKETLDETVRFVLESYLSATSKRERRERIDTHTIAAGAS